MRAQVMRPDDGRLSKLSDTERTELRRAAYARYRQTDGYRQAQARFKATGGRNRLALAHRERLRAERPEVLEAWQAVQVAVHAGRMVRPDGCTRCAGSSHLVAHHHRGYQPEHRLDVEWLCRPCHREAHR